MPPRIDTICINSEHPTRLIAFWTAFLETEVAATVKGITWLKPPAGGGAGLSIQQVDQKVAGHTDTHLDIHVDDLDAAQRSVEGLGGSLRSVQHLDDGFEWRIMADPDGNEFCIVPE